MDERVNFTNEVIDGIRLIKMYGMELAFEKMLSAYRSKEYKSLSKITYLNCINNMMTMNISMVSCTIMFIIIYYNERYLSLPVIFATIQMIE